jgi:hypothetical protein
MPKAKSFAVIALALSAPMIVNASADQWRKRPPRWEATSSRSLSDLQSCLGSRWAGTLSTKIVAMPIERGMSYTTEGERDLLVDVVDEGSQRRVKLWLRKYRGITVGAKEQIEKLSGCIQSRVRTH